MLQLNPGKLSPAGKPGRRCYARNAIPDAERAIGQFAKPRSTIRTSGIWLQKSAGVAGNNSLACTWAHNRQALLRYYGALPTSPRPRSTT